MASFVLAVLALCVPVHSASALEFPERPSGADYFVDGANMLDGPAKDTVNSIAAALLREHKIPLYVVTIPSRASYGALGMSIERYAQRLFDHWGIGWSTRNYGILLLVSRGDRKARIEFGGSYANRYNDQAATIMQTLIVPSFKRGAYATGIVDGVRGLDALVRGLDLPAPEISWLQVFFYVITGIGVAALVFNLFTSGRSGWAWAVLAFIGLLITAFLLTSRQDSSDGFGGGFSGGGGATGDW